MNISFQNWIEPLAWTLLHSLWQAAAIALLARVVTGAVRSRSAAFAATVHAVALAAVFVAAVTTCAYKMQSARPAPPLSSSQPLPSVTQTAVASDLPAVANVQRNLPQDLFPIVVAVWAAGVSLMSLRLVAGALWLRRLRRSAVPWADEKWQAKFGQWLADLGIRRTVRLCTTLAHETPAIIGYFKPLVLLPAALVARLAPEQLEAVILHELMHIRRHDYLVNLLRVAAETLFFFNPAVWWISRAIRLEREVACDQLVAEHTGNKLGYAKTLLRLEELHLAETGRLALAANAGPLKTRIARLLAIDRPAPAFAAWTGLACVALLLAALAAFGLPKTFAADASSPSRFQLRSVVEPGTADSETLPLVRTSPAGETSTNQLVVAKKVLLDENHFAAVKVVHDPLSNRPQIEVRLTPEGAALFKEITEQHVRKQIAIVIEGKVQSAPVVNEPITGGSLRISGNFTEDEARILAEKLAPKKRSAADPTEQIAAPNWTPPPGSLPSKILDEARADRRAARYEEALAKHVWYHTASRQEPGQGGVRLSFAMSDWLALGQAYPPALAKMKQMRAETERELYLEKPSVQVDRFTLFHEFSGFNWVLKEEHKTVELFHLLEEHAPSFAEQVYPVVQAVFARLGQKPTRTSYLNPVENPVEKSESLKRQYLENDYTYLTALLKELKTLKKEGELDALLVVYPDERLNTLLGQRAQAKQQVAQLLTDYSAEHPEVAKLGALQTVLQIQIDDRVEGIIKGLEVKQSVAKAALNQFEKKHNNAE